MRSIQVTDDRQMPVCLYDIDVDDMGLSVYEFRAYMRIVRRAAGGKSTCSESLENMALACKMSRPTLVRAVKSLLKRRMITRQSKTGETSNYSLTDKSLWVEPGKPQNHPLVNHRTTKITNKEYKEEDKGRAAPASSTPPVIASAPVQGYGDILEDMYPGSANDFRTMRNLFDLATRYQTTLTELKAFPAWFRERYPKMGNTPFKFRDFFPEYIQSSRTATTARRQYCGECAEGWLPPLPGNEGVRRCPCTAPRPQPAPSRQEVSL